MPAPKKALEVSIDDIFVVLTSKNYTKNQYLSIEPFLGIARWIARGINPYISIDSVLSAGLDDPEGDTENHAVYREMLNMHPKFPKLLNSLCEADDEGNSLQEFTKMMSDAMREARSQDTNSIKFAIIDFLPVDPAVETVQPPIIKTAKSVRGWSHKWTARALCPMEMIEEFDCNPELFMKNVQNGTIKPKARQFPSFLYAHDIVYDPTNKDIGLCRGHVLIRCLRNIYTGKSSGLTGHRDAARKSTAELNNITEVSPYMVAYAAAQAYVALSNVERWDNHDGYFQIEEFRDILLDIFTSDPDDPWVTETLAFLTKQLPALNRRIKRKSNVLLDSDNEQVDQEDPTGILAARKARKARQAAFGATLASEHTGSSAEHQGADTNEGGTQASCARPVTPPRSSATPPPQPPQPPAMHVNAQASTHGSQTNSAAATVNTEGVQPEEDNDDEAMPLIPLASRKRLRPRGPGAPTRRRK